MSALAEVEAYLAFKAALFDTANEGATLPPVSLGRCFRAMGVVEARAICTSYNEHLRRWHDSWRETGRFQPPSPWPLAERIGAGTRSSLCFKLRTGFPRSCWMFDGGGLIKFRGPFDAYYDGGPLADRYLADPDRIKWASWYVRKGRGR